MSFENKQLMQHIFAELAQGNSRPLDTELVFHLY
jgi:hypothetical protein